MSTIHKLGTILLNEREDHIESKFWNGVLKGTKPAKEREREKREEGKQPKIREREGGKRRGKSKADMAILLFIYHCIL